MKNFLLKASLIILFTVTAFVLKSQDVVNDGKSTKSEFQVYDYNRNALSMILENSVQKYDKELREAFLKIQVPSKFDDHTLPVRYITSNMYTFNIGNLIVAKWYNRQPDGSFNMDVIKQRGLYNATDLDVMNAASTRKGEDLIKDSGEKLLKNSYVLLINYPRLQTMEEYYDEMDQYYAKNKIDKRENREDRGWKSGYSATLYQLDWNDSIAAIFYNKCWVSEYDNDSIKQLKKKNFEELNIPLKIVTISKGNITSSVKKDNKYATQSDEELLTMLVSKGINQALEKLTLKTEAFQVDAAVFSTNPITTKIGSKEGLRIDDRYFVYENVLRKDNSIISKRRAIVRVKKVADNEGYATGSSMPESRLYKIGGRKIDEGMLLKQKDDKGFGVSVLWMSGLDEYKPSGLTFEVDYRTRLSPGLKVKMGGSIDGTNNPWNYSDINMTAFTRTYVGLCKTIYLGGHFQFEPAFNVGLESVTLSYNNGNEDDKVRVLYLEPNVRFGINLRYNIHVFGGVNEYIFTSYVTNSDGDKIDVKWTDLFPNRNGLSSVIGIKVEF